MGNNWILETAAGIIAVDTGFPGQGNRFLDRFGKHWPIDDLKCIFLTHAHNDHAGFVGELLANTAATVVLCENSKQILAEGRPNKKYEYKNWIGRILEYSKSNPAGSYPPVTDTTRMRIVCDNACCFEDMGISAQVVFLPGHSTDSIGLHILDIGVIFCGDAAMNHPFLNANRHTTLIENLAAFHNSWDKMLNLNPVLLYPGHGKPFKPADLVKYRDFLKS